jgi:hypothetical protein
LIDAAHCGVRLQLSGAAEFPGGLGEAVDQGALVAAIGRAWEAAYGA